MRCKRVSETDDVAGGNETINDARAKASEIVRRREGKRERRRKREKETECRDTRRERERRKLV